MIIQLKSALHKEDIESYSQIIEVLTGGTEGLFVEKVEAGEIDLTKPIYLVASGQSNSLAASLEILAYINQHGGKGEVIC